MSNTYTEGMDDTAMIPEGAPGRLVGETFFDWSNRTGLLPLLGPGDLNEIITEPDYEESLRKSVAIFGGTVEDYRSPGMTQEEWDNIGSSNLDPDPELQQRFVDSGTAAKVEDFLADPSTGHTMKRPEPRTRHLYNDPGHDLVAEGQTESLPGAVDDGINYILTGDLGVRSPLAAPSDTEIEAMIASLFRGGIMALEEAAEAARDLKAEDPEQRVRAWLSINAGYVALLDSLEED